MSEKKKLEIKASPARASAGGQLPMPAKNVIAVGSGKGGVGKSTVAVNLALALQAEGASVGFLDADLYGPSAPTMFGVKADEKPQVGPNQSILPLERHGVKLMSIGFLIPNEEAVIWRGPMLSKMLQQFLQQVAWDEPDFLIVDLPPGTGDIQLSLTQMIPLSSAIVVTTPQDVALADVKRATKMLEKTKVPILGIVENMAYFVAPDTGAKYHIFGGGADKQKLEALGAQVLAELPLETPTREAGDAGQPIVLAAADSEQAQRFRALARAVIEKQNKLNEQVGGLELPSIQDAYH